MLSETSVGAAALVVVGEGSASALDSAATWSRRSMGSSAESESLSFPDTAGVLSSICRKVTQPV